MLASMSSLIGSTPTSERVLGVVLAVVFGWLGWRISRSFAASRGVTPWRIPSLVWALICFIFSIFGLVLELVAQMTTRSGTVEPPRGPGPVPPSTYGRPGPYGQAAPPYSQPGPYGSAGAPPPYGQTPVAGPAPGYWPPAGPNVPLATPEAATLAGANQPAGPATPDDLAPPRLPAPPPGRDGSTALFGWYADVTARHEVRYWDGRGWTQFVRDAGVAAIDPI
jgi:hypothetical protein